MEIIAKNQYMAKEDRDPSDAALFYTALKKKKLLLALWRTATQHKEQTKIMQFLANDFDGLMNSFFKLLLMYSLSTFSSFFDS